MARKAVFVVVAFAIPALSLLSHPELRRVLMWDAIVLTFKHPLKAMRLLPSTHHPDELYLALKNAESLPTKEKWLAYERIYRETGKVWVGVFGLRYAVGSIRSGRKETLPTPVPPNLEMEKPSVEDVKRLLKLASELSQKDKGNAFPLLAKAYALFVLHRDDEALKTLHEAAVSPTYRTHDEWLKVMVSKNLTAEERLIASSTVTFPHMSPLRETMRLAVWHYAKAEAKGDYERALQIAEDVLRIGRKMREQGFWLIDSLVGISIQQIAFAGETRRLPGTKTLSPQQAAKRTRLLANLFAEFAERHGRKELAEWARREGEEIGKFRLAIPLIMSEEFVPGLTYRDASRITTTRFAGLSLLSSVVTLLVLALVTALFLFKSRVTIDRYAPVTATLVVGGLPLAVTIWSSLGTMKADASKMMTLDFGGYVFLLPVTVLLVLFLVCFSPAVWRLAKTIDKKAIAIVVGLPSFAGAIFLLIAKVRATIFISLLLAVLLIVGIWGLLALILLLTGRLSSPKPYQRILSGVALAIAGMVLVYSLLLLASIVESLRWTDVVVDDLLLSLTIALAVTSFAFLFAWAIWARFGREEYRSICQGVLLRLREAAILLAIVCWWGYAVVEFSSLPVRAKFHRVLDEVIVTGEAKLFLKRLEHLKPSG